MMRLAVEGIGVVAAGGNGLNALATRAQGALNGDRRNGNAKAETDALKQYLPLRALRRMDHFTRMTLLAAFEAVHDAGLETTDLTDTGIILATGYGPAALTFDFLDSIIDFGADMASPQAFAHSVHNIPAATVGLSMALTGPCTTVSQLDTAVPAALLTACTWLQEARVKRVLLGAVDEQTPLLHEIALRVAAGLPDAKSRRKQLAPGDGAVFFCLHADAARSRYGFMDDITLSAESTAAPFWPTFVSGCLTAHAAPDQGSFSLAPAYGSLPVAMAFDAALAILTVNGQMFPTLPKSPAIRCITRDQFGLHGSVTIVPKEHA